METIKKLLHGNQDDQTAQGTSNTTGTTSGHGSGLAGEGSHLTGSNTGNTTAGPHDSNLANKADPRVDSDLDGSRTAGTTTGAGGLSGSNTTAGPHSSNLANKADPRVDSDLDGSRTAGNTSGNTSGLTGQGSHLTGSQTGTTTAGPHDSNIANKLDPRVDSDRDGSRTAGNTSNTPGLSGSSATAGNTTGTGAYGSSTTAGPHDSNIGNKLDPRVDSDRDGSRTAGNTSGLSGSNTTGTGLSGSNTTAGPHDSNLLNKLDPRVDSDRDGSRTAGNTTSSDHHYGRDAAAVGAAGAAGEGIHHHHERERDNLGSSNTGLTGSNTTGGSNLGSSNTGLTGSNTGSSNLGPHSTDTANKLDPRVNTSGTTGIEDGRQHHSTHGGGAEQADSQHHLGRDAALGAGGVGLAEHHRHQPKDSGVGFSGQDQSATGTDHKTGHHLGRDAAVGAGGVGLAEHEHHKHHNERDTGVGSNLGGTQSSTGTHDTTSGSGHHLGRDAAVGAGGVGLAEHEHHKHHSERDTGVGSTSGVTQPSTGTHDTTSGSGHHLGRDAAVGAGGVGLAEHEHHKHEGTSSSSTAQKGDLPGPAPNTAGPHRFDILNKLDPRVNARPDQSQSTGTFGKVDAGPATGTSEHHHGRDAAGVGALGAGAYEADKHHNKHEHGATTTAGPHSSDAANKMDPRVDSDRSKDHHYGRDAAVAGGVGGAAYEAEKHHKHDKDLTQDERDAKREHKHELKEEKRHHKEEKREQREAEHSHHAGRDALGAGAVGTGAYEAEKHHHGHQHGVTDTNKPLPTAPGNHGIGTGAGTGNALAGDNTTTGHHDSHLGRDAALAGGAGAVGLHEHDKHHDQHATTGVPLDEKPRGKDLGDILHGADRNRGVAGSSGLPGTQGYGTGEPGTTQHHDHHLGRDAAVGAGGVGLAEHEHRKHEGSGIGNQSYDNTNTGSSGLTGSHQGQSGQHHLGRDAAVGAGGVGLAEHEHRKHEGSGVGHTSNISHPGDQQGQQHHYGRDTAGVGAAGLAGEHEYRKHEHGHEHGHGQQSGVTGSGYGSGVGSGTQSGAGNVEKVGPVEVATGEDGRHRLHKDPPGGFPAEHSGSHGLNEGSGLPGSYGGSGSNY